MTPFDPIRVSAVLIGLACFGLFYDGVVVTNWARHLPARYRATSFEVTFGVLVTCVGIGVICGIQTMLIALLCFAASGVFMIRGDLKRTDALG